MSTGFYSSNQGGRWQWLGDPVQHESAAATQDVLPFKIPDAPYSDSTFKFLHNAFDITHGVLATLEIFGVDLVGLGVAGLGLTVLGPIAAFVAGLMAMGEGYAEARAEISRNRMKMGFAEGFVAGADGASWKFVKSLFWLLPGVVFNAFDPAAGQIAEKSYNLGLATGFVQGHKLTLKQKRYFWDSLKLTDEDKAQYPGDHKQWSDRAWIDYYIDMAVRFIKLYVKE